MKFNPRKVLRKLNYLPRWGWYLCSFFMAGPFGIIGVYLAFHVLENMAKEYEEEYEHDRSFTVDVEVDGHHVHVGSRRNSDAHTASEEDEEEQIKRRWKETETSARRAARPQAAAQPAETEDDEVAQVLREGREALDRIRAANDQIPDPMLSEQIDSIETSCGQILTILAQRPQLLSQLRTFLRYYLPTTLRLLDARAKLENSANTPKAREVRQRISEALGVIDKALLKQVEALDEYRFIDLESEMDVLRDMMRADGLLDEERAQEDDPFADVLSKKYGKNPGNALSTR